MLRAARSIEAKAGNQRLQLRMGEDFFRADKGGECHSLRISVSLDPHANQRQENADATPVRGPEPDSHP